jgi:hypothetical protein
VLGTVVGGDILVACVVLNILEEPIFSGSNLRVAANVYKYVF